MCHNELVTFDRQSILSLSSRHTTSTMKIFIAICVLVVGTFCAPMLDNQVNSEWELFKRVHEKQYKTSEEESIRYVI